jgi:hypothetical protein
VTESQGFGNFSLYFSFGKFNKTRKIFIIGSSITWKFAKNCMRFNLRSANFLSGDPGEFELKFPLTPDMLSLYQWQVWFPVAAFQKQRGILGKQESLS